jgi:hypothetical protein
VVALSTPENQQAVDGDKQAIDCRLVCSVQPYLKEPGYKVAWIEKPLAAGFRASRRLIQAVY